MQKIRTCRLFATVALGVFVGMGSSGCQAQIAFGPAGAGEGGTSNQVASKPSADAANSDVRPVSAEDGPECADPNGNEQPATGDGPAVLPLPHELQPTVHPPYVIEPPDVLTIDAVRLIPRPPYRVEPLDVLLIQVTDALPNQPIAGPYAVSPEGVVNLGYNYGVVRVVGTTVEQAALSIRSQLQKLGLTNAQVSVSLVQFRGAQQIRGEHLVGQDGTINLGTYGSVNVTGLTVCQAKAVIERHLAPCLLNPEISLSVSAYNSKVYYVITDGGGFGQQVFRFPTTGKEYVLDAISNIGGLPAVSSRRKIWVARPAPAEKGCYQILPVDWQVITEAGATCTNYQLFPGDRIYVMADPLITIDNMLAKVFSPIERVLGVTLLGTTTVTSFRAINSGAGGIGFVPIGIR
jgi:polysaccharide export outer membrane protein